MRLYTKEYRYVKRPFAHHSLNSEIKDNYDSLADQEYEVDAKVETPSKDKDVSEPYVRAFLEDTRDIDVIRKEKRKNLVRCLLLFSSVHPSPRNFLLLWWISKIHACQMIQRDYFYPFLNQAQMRIKALIEC